MTTIALILIAVLLFELIIFVHEGGHFIAAKKSGVKVNEFSLGMGPRLFGFTKGETTYSFRLFPIGGYCAMEGEDEESENPRAFNNVKIWKRMIIIVAGAFMNIVLGLILMCVTLCSRELLPSTTVGDFGLGSYSAVTGLQEGDQIVSFNGYGINTYTDFSFALYTLNPKEVDGGELSVFKENCSTGLFDFAQETFNTLGEKATDEIGRTMTAAVQDAQRALGKAESKDEAYKVFCDCCDQIMKIADQEPLKKFPSIKTEDTVERYRCNAVVIRDGEKVELKDVDLSTKPNEKTGRPELAVDFRVNALNKNFGTVLGETFKETVSVVRMVWGGLAGLVTGRFSLKEMSGPVGLTAAITDVASKSLETNGFGSAVSSIVYVMMVITINLGVINMLPFPALDGGRFLMLLIEAIFHKPIPRKVEAVINTAGLVLLLTLTAVIAVKDIWQLFNGGFNYG